MTRRRFEMRGPSPGLGHGGPSPLPCCTGTERGRSPPLGPREVRGNAVITVISVNALWVNVQAMTAS